MPMNRKLYPKNWNAIALQVKEEANWHCQNCDRPCRMPGEPLDQFIDRLFKDQRIRMYDFYQRDSANGLVYRLLSSELAYIFKPGQFVLTVAHLNHDPSNNSPDNLRALCSVCHLRYDAIPHARSRRRNHRAKLEADGQLSLAIDT